MEKKLYKSKTDRKICGVCGGIAEYFGVSLSSLLDGEDGDVSAFLELFKKLSPEAKSALREYMAELLLK